MSSGAHAPILVAVVVTYERHDVVAATLRALDAQTRRPTHVVVVDNSQEPTPLGDTYVHAHENLGPAGGMQLGLRTACAAHEDWEWALLLDDDDPPLTDDAVERVLERAVAARNADASVRLVGLLGSSVDRRTGLFRSSCGQRRAVPVDFIGGGYLPLLHREAMIGHEGPFDPALFWGCEELDAGLRIRSRGGEVLAFDDLAEDLGYWRKRADVRASQAEGPLERRYYAWRNAIAVYRAHGLRLAAVATAVRVVASGLVGVLGFRGGRARAAIAFRALRDGFAGRLGRVVVATK